MEKTPIHYLDTISGNVIYVKREDLIPYSFGGNKARKAYLYFRDIDKTDADCVVTYGSSSSNHCRVTANMCKARKMDCIIISPCEASKPTFNSCLMSQFGAQIITVPVLEVHETIENILKSLRGEGRRPYFIAGGGHGLTGTQAYVDCYREITEYEKETGFKFDDIFFASGTGGTQAGLICGQLLAKDVRKIIGISIARKCPRGRNVIIDSVREYMGDRATDEEIESNTIFIDSYTGEGYSCQNDGIRETIIRVMDKYGMPLDSTYTGKAFWGMEQYIEQNSIIGKKILFIHTGGIPLYFDGLR